jgi:phage shock protein C
MTTKKVKKLLRSKNRMIAGVCAGIGEYLKIDPTIIRLLWVVFSFFSMGAGVLAYIIAWIIIPEK